MPKELTFAEYMSSNWPEGGPAPADAELYITREEGRDIIDMIYHEPQLSVEEFSEDPVEVANKQPSMFGADGKLTGKPLEAYRKSDPVNDPLKIYIEELRSAKRITADDLNIIIGGPA